MKRSGVRSTGNGPTIEVNGSCSENNSCDWFGVPHINTHMNLESLPQPCHDVWIDGQLLEWLRTLIASALSPSIL